MAADRLRVGDGCRRPDGRRARGAPRSTVRRAAGVGGVQCARRGASAMTQRASAPAGCAARVSPRAPAGRPHGNPGWSPRGCSRPPFWPPAPRPTPHRARGAHDLLALVPIALGPPPVGVAALAALLFVQRSRRSGRFSWSSSSLTGAAGGRRGRARGAPGWRRGKRVLGAGLAGLVLWLGLSLSWARHAAAGDPGSSTGLAAALIGVVATSTTEARHVLMVLRAFVAGAVASVTVGLASAALAPGEHTRGAHLLRGAATPGRRG